MKDYLTNSFCFSNYLLFIMNNDPTRSEIYIYLHYIIFWMDRLLENARPILFSIS